MQYEIIDMRTIMGEEDGLGGLTFIEGERDVPFPFRRVYWIHGTEKGVKRGFHAHISVRQLLFCPYGSIEILLDDGKEKASVMLDSPNKGLILYPGLWREMLWHQSGSPLCVIASEYYDAADYIRDYDEFLRLYGK